MMDQDQPLTDVPTEEESTDPHCTACNMPLTKAEDFGTNSDGSKNEQYCCHCMQGGTLM